MAKKKKPEKLVGRRFGRLIVEREAETKSSRRKMVMCRCDCGSLTKIQMNNLYSRITKQCAFCHHLCYIIVRIAGQMTWKNVDKILEGWSWELMPPDRSNGITLDSTFHLRRHAGRRRESRRKGAQP